MGIDMLASFLNEFAVSLVLCKLVSHPSSGRWPGLCSAVKWHMAHCCECVLTCRNCSVKLSTILCWLKLHAVFCLVQYISPLCQQVGGLESVLLYFDRNLNNETVLMSTWQDFFLMAIRTVGSQWYFSGNYILEKKALRHISHSTYQPFWLSG